jgi:uncharacterized protein
VILADASQWPFLGSLILLGFFVGILTGIFGVGGAFLIVPFLISLMGVDPALAIGTTMALSLVTGTYGFAGHWRLKNVEPVSVTILGLTTAFATVGGKWLQDQLRSATGDSFEVSMKLLLVAVVVPLACLMWFAAKRDVKPFLSNPWFKIPPFISLKRAGLQDVSLTAMLLCGIGVGLMKGMTAIGAGIIIVPVLIWVVGLPPLMAVGTSLGAMIVSSIAGVLVYAAKGEVEWRFVAALLIGGLFGTALGLRLVQRINNANLKRYFPMILLLVAATMIAELLLRR